MKNVPLNPFPIESLKEQLQILNERGRVNPQELVTKQKVTDLFKEYFDGSTIGLTLDSYVDLKVLNEVLTFSGHDTVEDIVEFRTRYNSNNNE